jgi:hypothetical protein
MKTDALNSQKNFDFESLSRYLAGEWPESRDIND